MEGERVGKGNKGGCEGTEKKDRGGKEESKGKSGCETKSWLRHCIQLEKTIRNRKPPPVAIMNFAASHISSEN